MELTDVINMISAINLRVIYLETGPSQGASTLPTAPGGPQGRMKKTIKIPLFQVLYGRGVAPPADWSDLVLTKTETRKMAEIITEGLNKYTIRSLQQKVNSSIRDLGDDHLGETQELARALKLVMQGVQQKGHRDELYKTDIQICIDALTALIAKPGAPFNPKFEGPTRLPPVEKSQSGGGGGEGGGGGGGGGGVPVPGTDPAGGGSVAADGDVGVTDSSGGGSEAVGGSRLPESGDGSDDKPDDGDAMDEDPDDDAFKDTLRGWWTSSDRAPDVDTAIAKSGYKSLEQRTHAYKLIRELLAESRELNEAVMEALKPPARELRPRPPPGLQMISAPAPEGVYPTWVNDQEPKTVFPFTFVSLFERRIKENIVRCFSNEIEAFRLVAKHVIHNSKWVKLKTDGDNKMLTWSPPPEGGNPNFIVSNFEAMTPLAMYGGEITRGSEGKIIYFSGYQVQLGFTLSDKKESNLMIDSNVKSPPELLQKINDLGNAHLVNHTCQNENCNIGRVVVGSLGSKFGYLEFPVISVKPGKLTELKEGDELTVNYGENYVKTQQAWLEMRVSKDGHFERVQIHEIEECMCPSCKEARKDDATAGNWMIKRD